MRIISGIYKGRRLISPENKKVRPTSDRAKETLFNILNNIIDFEGMNCLDLFCGSGALGLEAVSRGADKCVFADRDVSVVLKNIAVLKAEEKCITVKGDAVNYISSVSEKFDLIFCDPPYDFDKYDEVITAASKAGSFLALEHSEKFVLNKEFEKFLTRKNKTGSVNFSLLDFNLNE
ncbi:MAG: 16S rRNA (guanine(966)-N(2))-methyltransferase RsmD [Ignavibacteria bacterium]|nr:16S rRNA (guanine(966)-N(2))-methyltransferase RsmD [Ignavibacteria bacterium]